MDSAVLGHQPHPLASEPFERLNLSRVDGVVHDAGNHASILRPTAAEARLRGAEPNGRRIGESLWNPTNSGNGAL
jgi:hypothetical protein